MPEIIKVLIVEDSRLDIQSYEDAIKEVNREIRPELAIEAVFKTTKEEGLDALSVMKDELSAAFIDLKLTQGQAVDVNEGNDIVREIYGKLRFPVKVLTNTPGGFDGNIEQSLFLEVVTKADVDYAEVLKSIIKIHQTGVTKILGRRGLVENMLDNIFWKNISTTLSDWIGIQNSEKPLLRYTLTHLQEHLEISEDGGEFDTVYPTENYIKPSIKEYFFTGDIIEEKEDRSKRYIILTPACDLAPHGKDRKPKSSHVLLAKLEKLSDTPIGTNLKKAKKEIKSEEEKMAVCQAQESIYKLITNNASPQYYYLPDTSCIKGGLINFQKLSTIKYAELDNYSKEVTIAVQFLKDIIAKFSFYYSRQGSPDFDFNAIMKTILNN